MKHKVWYFIAPWLFGLCVFTLYPFAASFYYSFTDYSVLRSPQQIGVDNYLELFGDNRFRISIWNSLLYAALAIPSGMILAMTLAKALNTQVVGSSFYRAIVYLPNLVPTIASAILWLWILNPDTGLLTQILQPLLNLFGLRTPAFLADDRLIGLDLDQRRVIFGALPSLVLMALWSVGQMAIIYLAKLQDIAQSLYEAADLDGASKWQVFWHIELPQLSPLILFNAVMATIGTFQIFSEPYVMTQGGPGDATYLLSMFVYDQAFEYLRMGYACAAAWILFGLIVLLTVTAFRIGQKRVYYEGA